MFRLLFFICLSCAGLTSIAQSKDATIPVFFEKAYLHTDRDTYGQGEDIWFKAYVVNGQNSKPINYSHNLYVELISPGAKIVKRETIRLEDGLGNGDFKLSDTISPGRYRLRAYTNWMRNFGDNFIFEKGITILNTQAAPAATPKNVKIKKAATANSATALSAPTPTIRFFPEGGSLVEGISSIVGVKAEDGYGKGIMVSGSVLSSGGDTVSHFSCDSLGMGLVALLPMKGQSYYAVINLVNGLPNQVQHAESVFPLPLPLSTGLTLQVKQSDTVIHAAISSSAPSTTDKISFAVKHGGKTILSKQLSLPNQQTMARIPTVSLPEGISAITVYNSQGKPECERLVYIHHANNVNKVTITTDKKSYPSKGQVNLRIQAPPHTSLSLAAVDAGTVPVQPENIVSYLNLQSEIKGNIEHPDRYFDTTNINRFKQLNLLLLTQGWRDFIWKRLEDTTLKLSYEPEQGIAITGRVRRILTNKPLAGISVTMRAPKVDGQKLFWTTTDNAGRFSIYNIKFYGYQYLSFTSRKSSKINRAGESKGSSGGYIQVDSLLGDTPVIAPEDRQLQADTSWQASLQADAEIERIHKSLNLKAYRNLKEVTITAHTSRLYTTFPPEIHPITLVEQKDYDNLAQYLLYMIEGLHLLIDSTGNRKLVILSNGVWVKVPLHLTYADGSKMDSHIDEQLLNQPMSSMLKVTINRVEDVFGKYISVNILLRPGVMDTKDFFDNTVADVVGYYKARIFYTPQQAQSPDTPDTRTNTIHWEPNITTGATGKATVSFYNTAQKGKIRVVVEGITDSGTPLVSTFAYEVK